MKMKTTNEQDLEQLATFIFEYGSHTGHKYDPVIWVEEHNIPAKIPAKFFADVYAKMLLAGKVFYLYAAKSWFNNSTKGQHLEFPSIQLPEETIQQGYHATVEQMKCTVSDFYAYETLNELKEETGVHPDFDEDQVQQLYKNYVAKKKFKALKEAIEFFEIPVQDGVVQEAYALWLTQPNTHVKLWDDKYVSSHTFAKQLLGATGVLPTDAVKKQAIKAQYKTYDVKSIAPSDHYDEKKLAEKLDALYAAKSAEKVLNEMFDGFAKKASIEYIMDYFI